MPTVCAYFPASAMGGGALNLVRGGEGSLAGADEASSSSSSLLSGRALLDGGGGGGAPRRPLPLPSVFCGLRLGRNAEGADGGGGGGAAFDFLVSSSCVGGGVSRVPFTELPWFRSR